MHARTPLARIAVRKIGESGPASHPNTADHTEPSDTSFHDLRFYRYYRFSEKVAATQHQRPFMAVAFFWFYLLALIVGFTVIDWYTQPRYQSVHRLRRLYREKRAGKTGGFWQWQRGMVTQWKKMCDEDLPALRKQGHDSLTYRQYMEECSLEECLKRDPEFHTSLIHVGFSLNDCPGTHSKYDSDLDSP